MRTLAGLLFACFAFCRDFLYRFKDKSAEPQMQDVMVDLETAGNRPGCAIYSIGAVFFNPKTGELGRAHYRVINADKQQALGLHVDASTQAWWDKQSPEARQVLRESAASSFTLEYALAEFTEYLRHAGGTNKVRIWGNGADFDNAILAHAYVACSQAVPWEFWNNRCYRTLKNLKPQLKLEKRLVKHNALNDAVMQAEHACKLLAALRRA